jgi:hypothetical protein
LEVLEFCIGEFFRDEAGLKREKLERRNLRIGMEEI